MEKSQPPITQKSNSFSSSAGIANSDKLCHRNLSLNAIHFKDSLAKDLDGNNVPHPDRIDEGGEEEEEENDEGEETNAGGGEDQEAVAAAAFPVEDLQTDDSLTTLIDDIDQFLGTLRSIGEGDEDVEEGAYNLLPEIPESTIEKFVVFVEKEIVKYESGEEKLSSEHLDEVPSILDAVDRMSKLTDSLSRFASNPTYFESMNITGCVLHHAMSFLEDEFHSLLEQSSKSSKDQASSGTKTKRPPSFSRSYHDHDRCMLSPPADVNPADYLPTSDALTRLWAIATAMISSGYDTECRLVFATSRRNAFKASLSDLGFEKTAIDDVQRMAWDQLEGEIAKWIKSFRHSITASLCMERDLCYSVFRGYPSIAADIFYHLACNTTHNLLNFPEAIAMTKRSAEKLFKVLDMYEALKEMIPKIDVLFPLEGKGKANRVEEDTSEEKPVVVEEEESESEEKPSGGAEEEDGSSSSATDLKAEISAVKCRVGEAAVAIFCELENSIKNDAGKNSVPGGAVHPLTRYVMNYLKYACEYINTLEQIFKDHKKSDDSSSSYDEERSHGGGDGQSCGSNSSSKTRTHRPFETQLTEVMDLLQSNLVTKAKLYKELALSSIFMMNNGRYIVQKVKGSPEINKLLGNTWCRQRSSDLRQYHKNYQRETWSKVLACFKDDGLTVKGSVSKPVLKERFKSFNALFDEIHKVQSTWVVSDEQLQSELRVSISAVVIPAYRSFLGRFQQYLDPGRQTEKYIKISPEDLETAIDNLFDGNSSSIVRRRP